MNKYIESLPAPCAYDPQDIAGSKRKKAPAFGMGTSKR